MTPSAAPDRAPLAVTMGEPAGIGGEVALKAWLAGEVSPPVRSGNGIALLMVCERDERDTSEEGRKRVERQLRAERLAAESRRYLRDLRRTAFVDVRR